MRVAARARWTLAAALAPLLTQVLVAQVDAGQPQTIVTVWVVFPATAAERSQLAARKIGQAITLPTTVQESTAGSFGQPSSNVGQTAGSYGTPSSNTGRNASDHGQTAGSYGRTAGSLGTASSNAGQTAGSYGQTASSYGQTAGSYGQTSSTYSDGRPLPPRASAEVTAARAGLAAQLTHVSALPSTLQVQTVSVTSEELQDALFGVQGTGSFPDVVVGALPESWDASGWGVEMLGSLRFEDLTAQEREGRLRNLGRAAVLLHAPHPAAAREYVLRLREGPGCGGCVEQAKAPRIQPAVALAVSAVGRVMLGGSLGGDADDEAATFHADLAERMAWHPPSETALNGVDEQVQVLAADANERFAVISALTLVSSRTAFGAAHSIVVLRKDSRGHWRVLQISPGVPPALVGSAGADLLPYAQQVAPSRVAHVAGISQASPLDGDIRPPQPRLWWDNGGGADMQVVEWQRRAGAAWTATSLLLAPDHDFKVRTEVTADFANANGEYRWRVWSVGIGGAMTISPWRKLTILR